MERSRIQKERQPKAVLKKRKISSKALAQWRPLTQDKKSVLLTLLQEAIEPFSGSDDGEINATLQKIKDSFKELVDVAQVPKDKWLSPKAIYLHRAKLLEEQDEVKSLEAHLLSILDEKKKEEKKMETKTL